MVVYTLQRIWAISRKPVIMFDSRQEELMPEQIASVISVQHAEQLAAQTEEALECNHAEAERLARELVDVMQILYGPCHIEVGVALFYLALALEEQGQISEAMDIRKRARKIFFTHGLWRN
jgi:hypothetical protein